jgi:hypothetical protein
VNWRSLFTSKYTLFIENELTDIRERHRKEIEQINNTHAAERERYILEANRGWAEADRLRLYLIPGLPASTRTDTAQDSTPNTDKVESGTPFQKIAKRVMAEDLKRYQAEQAAKAKPVAVPAQEKN